MAARLVEVARQRYGVVVEVLRVVENPAGEAVDLVALQVALVKEVVGLLALEAPEEVGHQDARELLVAGLGRRPGREQQRFVLHLVAHEVQRQRLDARIVGIEHA